MIIDAHTHVLSFPSFRDLSDRIQTTEDVITFTTRYPELAEAIRSEPPIDNSDDLLADMGRYGVSAALVMARPGRGITNEMVADVARKHPRRLFPLFSFAKDQQDGHYLDDPAPVREQVVQEIPDCVERLGMKGMGETSIRALTNEMHPERIAKDLEPIMRALGKYRVPMQIQTAWTQWRGGLLYSDPYWVDELAGRHPDVPIILTKMGRGFTIYFEMALIVALRNVNVYFDTVGTTSEHLRIAVDKLGAHRVMFGTDWSTTWRWVRKPADLYTMRLRVVDAAQLSEADREQVLWKTAAQLFKLDLDGAMAPRE